MPNTILTPTAVTREALRVLHQKLNFVGNIVRDYDDSFAQKGAKIGDTIKVEVPIPSGDQIAWFARVVRIQEYDDRSWFSRRHSESSVDQIMVGLKFEELPEPHSRAIRKGIEQSFLKALQDQQVRRVLYYKAYFFQNIVPILGYAALILAAVGLIYALTRPSDNYDAKRGAPWGERFKFF
jgi:hypothetical protein